MSELDQLYSEIMILSDENEALRKELDGWRNLATVFSIKLKVAIDTLEYYAGLSEEKGFNRNPAQNALIEIEGE